MNNIKCYCWGIAYATGYIAKDGGKTFLCVRNIDGWYPKCIENISLNKAYMLRYNIERDNAPQWAIKARNISELPKLSEITSPSDFLRAYIEIHGTLDLSTRRSRSGEKHKAPRLRIFGQENILDYIQAYVPAAPKSIQNIVQRVDDKYIGKTCVLYYQSRKEIADILEWIDGSPRNEKVWEKWQEII